MLICGGYTKLNAHTIQVFERRIYGKHKISSVWWLFFCSGWLATQKMSRRGFTQKEGAGAAFLLIYGLSSSLSPSYLSLS
jgi:hypothetical protein